MPRHFSLILMKVFDRREYELGPVRIRNSHLPPYFN
jgi:hypothetical protein